MSIDSLTSTHTLTLKRTVEVQGAAGGRTNSTPTTAGRGSLPTSLICRVSLMSAQERIDFGVRGTKRRFKVLSTDNPQMTSQDTAEFVDLDSVTITMKVIANSHWLDPDQRLYRFYAEEDTAEE